MPRFYFHLTTPRGVDLDRVGCEFPSAEHACAEAGPAALEMAAEALRSGEDPAGYGFDIRDEGGASVLELPFSDMLRRRPGPTVLDWDLLQTRAAENHARSRELQDELAAGLLEVRQHLAAMSALLGRNRPRV